MIKQIRLNAGDWYNHAVYPSEGIYLVSDENGNRQLMIVDQSAVWAGYFYGVGMVIPNWIHDLLDTDNSAGGQRQEVPEFKVSEDLFLKAMAIARGQEISGL